MTRPRPLAHATALGLGVLVVDLASKMIAVAALGDATVFLPGDAFLSVVYNDAFMRGLPLEAAALPATLLLAAGLLLLLVRVCAPLAEVDGRAPVALGLIGGAAAANAADFARTGVGVVDFLGVPAGGSAVVFNLADVAAYLGLALLVRTALRLAQAVAAQRATENAQLDLALDAAFEAGENAPAVASAVATAQPRGASRRRRGRAQRPAPAERARPVPVFREGVVDRPDRPPLPSETAVPFPSSIEAPPGDRGAGSAPRTELR